MATIKLNQADRDYLLVLSNSGLRVSYKKEGEPDGYAIAVRSRSGASAS